MGRGEEEGKEKEAGEVTERAIKVYFYSWLKEQGGGGGKKRKKSEEGIRREDKEEITWSMDEGNYKRLGKT